MNKFNLGELNVSRETMELLNSYVDLLKKWNRAINLISSNSMCDVWERHFLDSAQLIRFLSVEKKNWVDLGSGAGFPGLVIAILAKEKFPGLKMTLIESDKRKCIFLNEVARASQLDIKILSNRIEDCPNLNADVISARALAPMKKLLLFFDLHGKNGCKGLFLKGKNLNSELRAVDNINRFKIKVNLSLIDANGCIAEVEKRN